MLALWLPAPPARPADPVLPAARDLEAYLGLVERYRLGEETAEPLADWSVAEVGAAVGALLRETAAGPGPACAGRCLLAAALLHLDAAQRLRERQADATADFHVKAARRALDGARPDEPSPAFLQRFRRAWLMALGYHNLSSALLVRAADAFEELLGDEPGNARAWTAAGTVQETLGTLESEGGGPVWELPVLRTGIFESGWRLALAAEQERARKAALRHYEQALRLAPGLSEARLRRARLLLLAKRGPEAVSQLESVLRETREPRLLYLAHLLLGGAAEAAGRSAEALAHFKDALRADPDSPSARLALSHAQQRAGDLRAAGESARAALASQPPDGRLDAWIQYPLGPPGAFEEQLGRLRAELRP